MLSEPRPALFGLQPRCVKHSPSFADQLEAVARSPTLHRQRVKLRKRTPPQRVTAWFSNCLTKFDHPDASLRTRTPLARRNAALGQSSLRFLLSEHPLPFLSFRWEHQDEDFRAAWQVVEAPVATQRAIGQSYARARCIGTRVR